MSRVFRAYNFAAPTTATPVLVTTGTAIKTMLQIATPATVTLTITEWGVMTDAGSTVARVELVETDVAATVTAHVAAGIMKMSDPTGRASNVTVGSTTGSGYTATAEGTTTASRLLDFTTIANTGKEWHQLPLGREPSVGASKFLRVRVTASVAVNMCCYVEWEED